MIELIDAYSEQIVFVAACFGLLIAVVLLANFVARPGRCGCVRCQRLRAARERLGT